MVTTGSLIRELLVPLGVSLIVIPLLGSCSHHFDMYKFLTKYAVISNTKSQVFGFVFLLTGIFSWSPEDVTF